MQLFICMQKNMLFPLFPRPLTVCRIIYFQSLHQLPAVWFSWDELFTAMVIPIRNNTIVTVDRTKQKIEESLNTDKQREPCNPRQTPLEGARSKGNTSAAPARLTEGPERRARLLMSAMSVRLSAEQLKSLWEICSQSCPVKADLKGRQRIK